MYMKKIFKLLPVLFCIAVSALPSFAKNKIPNLSGQTKMLVVIDTSGMTINNMSVSDWLVYRQADQPDWDARAELDKEIIPVLPRIVFEANKWTSNRGLALTLKEETEYKLVLKIIEIDTDGDFTSEGTFYNTVTGEEIGHLTLEGEGGVFGRMGNLFGDSCENAGRRLGRILSSALRNKK